MKQKNNTANTKVKKTYLIALGSNLYEREKNLKASLQELKKIGKIKKTSKIYETAPVGYKDQGKFLNQAIEFVCMLNPNELIEKTQEIEQKMGRTKTIKNGPRIIDIDILLCGNEIISTENLKIPHPEMHKRKFVLEPLSEISPKKIHPILRKQIKTLWTNLK